MKPTFFLVPAGRGQGLTTVALGLVVALDRRGVRISFYKPISEEIGSESRRERSTHFLRATTTISPADPLPLAEATKLISDGRLDEKTTMHLSVILPGEPGFRQTLNAEIVNGEQAAT